MIVALLLVLESPDEDETGWTKLLVDTIVVALLLMLEGPDEDGMGWAKLLEGATVVALTFVLEDSRTQVLEDELHAVGCDHELEELGAVG